MRRNFLMRGALGAALLGVACAPALAVPSTQYRACDGYGAPSDAGDGMTEYARILGIFNPTGYGTTARSAETLTGDNGVAACDAALTDVPEAHWMRRVSLLRARAIHHLEAHETAPALADLDLAQAAAKDPNDIYFARSLGLGMDIVRAEALKEQGQGAQAATLTLAAIAKRPYNRQVYASAFVIFAPAPSPADEDVVLRGISRLLPAERSRLFAQALKARKFADAIALYPHIAPSIKPGFESGSRLVQGQQDVNNARISTIFWAYAGGEYAYALAASGRDTDAAAMIQTASDKLAHDTRPPEPIFDPDDKEEAVIKSMEQQTRAAALTTAKPLLDAWSKLVDARIRVNEGKAAEVLTAMPPAGYMSDWAADDLRDAIQAKLPKGKKPSKSAPQSPVMNFTTVVAAPSAANMTGALFKVLPEAESPGRIPVYEEAKKPFFAFTGSRSDTDTEGWRVYTEDGATTVGFRGVRSTASVVEEMALLRVAELAKEKGKTGFVITGRHDTEFTINTTYYGATLRTDPDGYQTQLNVDFIDLADPPPEYAGTVWLAFNADDVYAALAPLYIVKKEKKAP